MLLQDSYAQSGTPEYSSTKTPSILKKKEPKEIQYEIIVKPDELSRLIKMILAKEIPVDKILVPASGLEIRQIIKSGFEGGTLQISLIRPTLMMDDSEIILVLFAIIEQKKSGKTKMKKRCFVEYTEGIFIETNKKGEDKELAQRAINYLLSLAERRQ